MYNFVITRQPGQATHTIFGPAGIVHHSVFPEVYPFVLISEHADGEWTEEWYETRRHALESAGRTDRDVFVLQADAILPRGSSSSFVGAC